MKSMLKGTRERRCLWALAAEEEAWGPGVGGREVSSRDWQARPKGRKVSGQPHTGLPWAPLCVCPLETSVLF